MSMLPRACVAAIISGHGDVSHATKAMTDGLGLDVSRDCWVSDPVTIESVDVVVGVVDGAHGLGADFAQAWSHAQDHHIPRLLLMTSVFDAPADFMELVAIADRALSEDICVRFFPLANDDGNAVAGVLDVMDNTVWVAGGSARPADREHVELTTDARDECLEHIAHAKLTDAQLADFRNGLPTSLPGLRNAWESALSDDSLVVALPVATALREPMAALLHGVVCHWIPVVRSGDESMDVTETTLCVGLGIGPGVARVWNCTAGSDVVVTAPDQATHIRIDHDTSLLWHDTIRVGSVIAPPTSDVVVLSPGI